MHTEPATSALVELKARSVEGKPSILEVDTRNTDSNSIKLWKRPLACVESAKRTKLALVGAVSN